MFLEFACRLAALVQFQIRRIPAKPDVSTTPSQYRPSPAPIGLREIPSSAFALTLTDLFQHLDGFGPAAPRLR